MSSRYDIRLILGFISFISLNFTNCLPLGLYNADATAHGPLKRGKGKGIGRRGEVEDSHDEGGERRERKLAMDKLWSNRALTALKARRARSHGSF